MKKSKFRLISLAGALICLAGAHDLIGQEQCPTPIGLYMGGGPVEPCTIQQVSIPVYMNNACAVGGFEIIITTADPNWFSFDPDDPDAADTIASRLGDWELFLVNVDQDNPGQISVIGIADLPGGQSGVQLPPGDGLIFSIQLNANVYTFSDTTLPVIVTTANISDTSGYILFDVEASDGAVQVLSSDCDGNPRGDCNCNGIRNGIDIVYLVNYLKGFLGFGICGGCAGDSNDSGAVNGIDVTYLLNYLKGLGPEPAPCD